MQTILPAMKIVVLLSIVFTCSISLATGPKPPHILVRSSWQTVNIGDVAHTPGILRLISENIPAAEITLWPMGIDSQVEQILRTNFPKVHIVTQPREVEKAFADCDFLLHSSGPSLVAQKDIAKWKAQTSKPYGVYGITLGNADAETRDLLSHASFVYFRDSVSLEFAKKNGIACPLMDFTPDAAFAVNIRNEKAAEAFLKQSGLEEGKFMCVIPRYRKSPYWIMRHKEMTPKDHAADALNQKMKEHDNKPLRDAIIAVVRNTSMKVLVCPEDESQVALGKEVLFDPLPADVKARVVWRDHYWYTDEALSTYVRSAGLFGLEMHSPILCIGNGIPAIVCRFAEQTSKGYMWRDIGLGEWLFDMDKEAEIHGIVPAVLAMAKDPAAAKAKALKARAIVQDEQRKTVKVLADILQKELKDSPTQFVYR